MPDHVEPLRSCAIHVYIDLPSRTWGHFTSSKQWRISLAYTEKQPCRDMLPSVFLEISQSEFIKYSLPLQGTRLVSNWLQTTMNFPFTLVLTFSLRSLSAIPWNCYFAHIFFVLTFFFLEKWIHSLSRSYSWVKLSRFCLVCSRVW